MRLNAHLVDKLSNTSATCSMTLASLPPPASYDRRFRVPFQQVALADYMNAGHTPRLLGERGSDNVVAVLYLEGEIVDGWGEQTNIGGDRFAAELRELRKDDDVKAVVLRVNSPGGSAYASEVIQREIIALKAKKPVIGLDGQLRGLGRILGLDLRGPYLRRAEYAHRLDRRLRHVHGLSRNWRNNCRHHVGCREDRAVCRFRIELAARRPTRKLALAQARVDDLYGKFLDKVSDSRHIPRGATRTDPHTHRCHRTGPRLDRHRCPAAEAG